jgi:AcrR family transcriptional regulator
MAKLKLLRAHTSEVDPLIRTAGQLFRQKGFAATTVRDIASAAGVLPGSLHYRYATKEAMLLALMEQGIAKATSSVRNAIASSSDPLERIRFALRAHLHMLLLEDDSIYVLLYEWRALTGEARESMARLRDRYDSLWDGLLYEAAGTTKLRTELDLKLVRLSVLGAVNWVAQWYSPEGESTPDEIADTFADNIFRGILSDRAQHEKLPPGGGKN